MRHVVVLIERPLSTLWLDRRVLNQARTLARTGWRVTILGLGDGQHDETLEIDDNVAAVAFAFHKRPPRRRFIEELTGIPNDRIGRMTEKAADFEARLSQVVAGWETPPLDALFPLEFFGIDEREYERVSFPQSIFSMYAFTDYFSDYALALKPDLIWVADHHGARAGWRLNRECGIPYILDFHELNWGQNHRSLRERKIVHQVEVQAARSALAVTSVSELIAELIGLDFGLPQRPLHLGNVPAFTRVDRAMGRQRVERVTGAGPDDCVLLFHGIFGQKQRNIELLLDAYAAVRPARVHLLFVGRGDCEEDIRAAGAGVHLHPMVDQAALAEFVAGSDFVLLPYQGAIPNNRFSAANKFHDAIFLRTPLIVSDDLDDAALTVVEHGIGWVMPMKTVDDMAAIFRRAEVEQPDLDGMGSGFKAADQTVGATATFERLERLSREAARYLDDPRSADPNAFSQGPLEPYRYIAILKRRRDAAASAGRTGVAARIDDFIANRLPLLCERQMDPCGT